MCHTCTFDFPGGIKICPTCAANPRTAISPKRKKMLIGSFALAVWSTLVAVALFLGIVEGVFRDPAGQQALGSLIMVVVAIPSLIGLVMGIVCMDRRMTNTTAMWVATVWNGLMVGGIVLLVVAGLLRVLMKA